ncbi:MAG: nucleotidyltransferase family protein [Phycisphaerales bacterium]|nr:MAG: nucleotidyltransferase family protein [Phycisphaerales bacterium]
MSASIPSRPNIWAIVPAAGVSRRMGRPKQLMPWGDTDMASHVCRTLLEAGVSGLILVTRRALVDAMDLPRDPRVRVAFNEECDSQMLDSIRIGLETIAAESRGLGEDANDGTRPRAAAPSETSCGAACPPTGTSEAVCPPTGSREAARRPRRIAHGDVDGVMVLPADVPGVCPQTCRDCTAAFAADPRRIVVATCEGRRGHPIIFPWELRAEVSTLKGGLRDLLAQHPDRLLLVDTADPGVTQNVNAPQDYPARTAPRPNRRLL